MTTRPEAAAETSAPAVYINELGAHEGELVTVRGWVQHHRSKGKLQFVVLRDGTGTVQAVAFQDDMSPEVWERFGELTQESSLLVTGLVAWLAWRLASSADTSVIAGPGNGMSMIVVTPPAAAARVTVSTAAPRL